MKLSKRQKEILVHVLKSALDNGTFLYLLSDKELDKDINVSDKLIDKLIKDYKLEKEGNKSR